MHDALSHDDSLSPSLRVGDLVIARRDLLVEVARRTPGAPPRWQLVEAGARGRVIGWRDRRDDEPSAVVELDGSFRLVVFVREASLAGTRRPSA